MSPRKKEKLSPNEYPEFDFTEKNICPDKTRRMLRGKQETIVFVLASQKKQKTYSVSSKHIIFQ